MIELWDNSKCCCHAPDGRECYRSRYSVSPDDFGQYPDDQDCECACHNEYVQSLEDHGLLQDWE